MGNLWKSLKEYSRKSKKEPGAAVHHSHYSLVSGDDVTTDTIQLWLALPDEVKNDPAWTGFRQLYEQQNAVAGIPPAVDQNPPKARLVAVNSAPELANDLHNEQCAIDLIEDGDTKEDRERKRKKPSRNDIVPSSSDIRRTKIIRTKCIVKMTLLLACWVFFTAVFLTYNEKKEIVQNSAIKTKQDKIYPLPNTTDVQSIQIKLTGPFLLEQAEVNSTDLGTRHKIQVWIELWPWDGDLMNMSHKELTPPWTIHLVNDKNIDFSRGEIRTRKFTLEPSKSGVNQSYVVRMNTTSAQTVPFALSYTLNPLDASTGVVYAVVLLCGLYILVIFEVINRTMAAIVVATLSLAVLSIAGERPTVPEMISWLDAETLILLFSMMLLVAIMAETGVFDFLAVFTFQVTKGKLWPLIFLLCGITAGLSTFLDNVTTVLLMSPVTIRLCEVMDLDPVPILMFMAIYSNVGGTATPVGDPPCVIVASNRAVVHSGINFTNFTAHMSLGILLVFVQTTLQIRYMFRDTDRLRLNVPRDIQDLRNQISIWRRAAESLPHLSKDVHVVRERLERKVQKLTVQLDILVKQSHKRACPKETYRATLKELKDKYKIRDKTLLIKASVAICFVVTLFFLHSIPEMNRVSLGWTALLGAILLLVLADREDLEPILHRVEWSTLLFFAALFVLMEALSKLGLILYVGMVMEKIIMQVEDSSRLAVAIVIILWVSGVISAFVDNIPLSTMMVRVVVNIGNNPSLNLPLGPLIWALLFGSCLGGNGTLIGASANVVCAGVAEQHGYKFTFVKFFKVGFPIMIGHLIVSTAYLLLCHCVFTWH